MSTFYSLCLLEGQKYLMNFSAFSFMFLLQNKDWNAAGVVIVVVRGGKHVSLEFSA